MTHVVLAGSVDRAFDTGGNAGRLADKPGQSERAELANLRRARIRVHKNLRQTEALLAGYKAKLEAIETAIFAISPELKLPLQHREYNKIFKRGEYTRIILDVLREAGEPLPLREIAMRALALKGITMPDYTLRKRTRTRLGTALVVFQARGVVEKVGRPGNWVWKLVL